MQSIIALLFGIKHPESAATCMDAAKGSCEVAQISKALPDAAITRLNRPFAKGESNKCATVADPELWPANVTDAASPLK